MTTPYFCEHFPSSWYTRLWQLEHQGQYVTLVILPPPYPKDLYLHNKYSIVHHRRSFHRSYTSCHPHIQNTTSLTQSEPRDLCNHHRPLARLLRFCDSRCRGSSYISSSSSHPYNFISFHAFNKISGFFLSFFIHHLPKFRHIIYSFIQVELILLKPELLLLSL